MKRLIMSGVTAMAVARVAWGAPDAAFNNTSTINSPPSDPPQVYATNFINSGAINIAFNSFSVEALVQTFIVATYVPPYDFSDVLNYTNRGILTCDAGFRFDTAPSAAHGENFARHRAGSFGNANIGVIAAGSGTNILVPAGSFTFFSGSALPQLRIAATNVNNKGVLDVGINGYMGIDGANVDLSYGELRMEGIDFAGDVVQGGIFCTPVAVINPGIYDDRWGIGRGTNIGGTFDLAAPTTPLHRVTQAGLGQTVPLTEWFTVPNPIAIAFTGAVNGDPADLITQVVFAGNLDSSVAVSARFQDCGRLFQVPVIQWSSVVTNGFTGETITNTLYLSDFFGGSTNFQTITNYGLTGGLIPSQSPVNYQFSRSYFGYDSLSSGNTLFDPLLLADADGATNSYSALDVTLAPVSARPDPNVPGSVITNTAGRIEINADRVLDLTGARLSGPNYLRIAATNHFVGSEGAQFVVPYNDFYLGSTNGRLAITNLVAPFVPEMAGQIMTWSGQWTNVVGGVTNRFHVLMVGSSLVSTSPCAIFNFSARSTNVIVSDRLNIYSNLFVDAPTLTLTANEPGAANSMGEMNLLAPQLLWSSSLPNLQYLTNSGLITSPSGAFFQKRLTPNYANPSDAPYQAMVNHGSINMSGITVWANYFENTGSGAPLTNGFLVTTNMASMFSVNGPISITAGTAILTNGAFTAVNGDISLSSPSLVISNHFLQAGGKITLAASNQFNPGGRTWTNFWQASDSMDLPVKPPTGDLMGTTLTSVATNYITTTIWAGEDRGYTAAGFTDNMAIGHVIFDALTNAGKFRFTGATANNAIYIDLIELKDHATDRQNPNFSNFIIDSNIKIYFADAQANGVDISDKLNGANNGRFCWVSNYNDGVFSSTNLVYPSGQTYQFNRGLVLSSSVDSDGDGIVNSADSTPFIEPETVGLKVVVTKSPTPAALVSWRSPAYATNSLYAKSSLVGTNWILVTNFVQGPFGGTVSVTDSLKTNGACLYKVGISPR